jgi:hypothetical protein
MPLVIHRRGRTMNAEIQTEILQARGRRLQELPGRPSGGGNFHQPGFARPPSRHVRAYARPERRTSPDAVRRGLARISHNPTDLVSRCRTDRTLTVPRRASEVGVDPLRLVSRVIGDAPRRAVWANAASQRLYE